LYHFPLETLRRLLTDVGFDCESTHHFSLRQNPFGWIQSALNKVKKLPRNGLYVLLHRRAAGVAPPYSRKLRGLLRGLYWLGVLPALSLSVLEAICRSGATVHVVARRTSPDHD
jgi:hypothetical protein